MNGNRIPDYDIGDIIPEYAGLVTAGRSDGHRDFILVPGSYAGKQARGDEGASRMPVHLPGRRSCGVRARLERAH